MRGRGLTTRRGVADWCWERLCITQMLEYNCYLFTLMTGGFVGTTQIHRNVLLKKFSKYSFFCFFLNLISSGGLQDGEVTLVRRERSRVTQFSQTSRASPPPPLPPRPRRKAVGLALCGRTGQFRHGSSV